MSLADMESTTFNVEARQHTVSSDIERINRAMEGDLDMETPEGRAKAKTLIEMMRSTLNKSQNALTTFMKNEENARLERERLTEEIQSIKGQLQSACDTGIVFMLGLEEIAEHSKLFCEESRIAPQYK